MVYVYVCVCVENCYLYLVITYFYCSTSFAFMMVSNAALWVECTTSVARLARHVTQQQTNKPHVRVQAKLLRGLQKSNKRLKIWTLHFTFK